ncbi:MAG: 1-acyl-sn-glycerol-3-phosphate acyltransferase [Chloroflexi bacterium]|nr:1-acyl-sn-glycerol-3-phosphate acyltransferase [Chloroflexota bacterium]
MMRFQRFAKSVFRALCRVLLRLDITGLQHVPPQGRLLIMMNHVHFLDPIVVSAFIRRDMGIMSKIENFLPVLGYLVKWYGSFPVRRGEFDLAAIRASLAYLESERGLLMAPEGTRSKTGGLQPGLDGLALLAIRGDAPILPVAIHGHEAFLDNLKRLRRTPFHMTIGQPFRLILPEGAENGNGQRRVHLQRSTQAAMYELARHLPEAYRGVYADLENAPQGYIQRIAPSHDSAFRPKGSQAAQREGVRP